MQYLDQRVSRRRSRCSRRKARPAARRSTSTRATGTVILAAFQAYGIGGRAGEPSSASSTGGSACSSASWSPVPDVARRGSPRGVGNGRFNRIIFAGMVALPGAMIQNLEVGRTCWCCSLIALMIGVVVVVAVVVFRDASAHHRPVSNAARSATACMVARPRHLPLKINTSGVIPHRSSRLRCCSSRRPSPALPWMPAMVAGKSSSEDAKIGGMTPEVLILSGRCAGLAAIHAVADLAFGILDDDAPLRSSP